MLKPRAKHYLEIAAIFFAFLTVITSATSTYFAYRTIELYSEQSKRERRQEMMEWISLAGSLLKGIAEEVKNKECAVPSNDNQPTPP